MPVRQTTLEDVMSDVESIAATMSRVTKSVAAVAAVMAATGGSGVPVLAACDCVWQNQCWVLGAKICMANEVYTCWWEGYWSPDHVDCTSG
jgi:hypothetical protein